MMIYRKLIYPCLGGFLSLLLDACSHTQTHVVTYQRAPTDEPVVIILDENIHTLVSTYRDANNRIVQTILDQNAALNENEILQLPYQLQLNEINFHIRYQAHLSKIDFNKANLDHANFGSAILTHANFNGAFLRGSSFAGGDLSHAKFNQANLEGANLSHINLRYGELRHANLENARLKHAHLEYADLREATLTAADLRDAHYNANTVFPEGFDPELHGMIRE